MKAARMTPRGLTSSQGSRRLNSSPLVICARNRPDFVLQEVFGLPMSLSDRRSLHSDSVDKAKMGRLAAICDAARRTRRRAEETEGAGGCGRGWGQRGMGSRTGRREGRRGLARADCGARALALPLTPPAARPARPRLLRGRGCGKLHEVVVATGGAREGAGVGQGRARRGRVSPEMAVDRPGAGPHVLWRTPPQGTAIGGSGIAHRK